jgi:NAD(P)H dehydrogenase (quinone)
MMSHLGMIIVPLGYSDPSLFKAGTPYGATFVSNKNTQKPGPLDLDVAKYQGVRVANVAARLTQHAS